MKKLTGFIVKLLPLGLLLGLCIALSGCGKMQRINLNDLMSYEITGYSGQGKLTWDLDSENYDYYIGISTRLTRCRSSCSAGIWGTDTGIRTMPLPVSCSREPTNTNMMRWCWSETQNQLFGRKRYRMQTVGESGQPDCRPVLHEKRNAA